jgi:hypothetical protein
MSNFESFTTWDEVLNAARRGDRLWYQAPLDRSPHSIIVEKIYKNGKLRINPLSNQVDKFNADAGHLARFRKRVD